MLSQEFANTSVSHATMRPEDLIPTFASFLNGYVVQNDPANEYAELVNEAMAFTAFDTEEAHYLLEELFDALNEVSPYDCYFGSHPGDGSDYGFWTAEEE